MLALAPLIGLVLSDAGPPFPNNYALLFGVSGLLFAISIVPGLFFRELPGGAAVEQLPTVGDFVAHLGTVLRQDRPYRAFIVLRLFTSLFTMALPFYIGYATVELGLSSAVAVPVLLVMQTAGSLAGALIYTWLGGRDNVLYIRLAMLCSALLPVSALLAGSVGPLPLYVGFFVSGLASGALLFASYTNWVVGYAHADQRPIYVGLSNTAAAVFTLFAPFIAGTIAQELGYRSLFVVALVMALSALFVALRYLRNQPG
jgi:MFS family permease